MIKVGLLTFLLLMALDLYAQPSTLEELLDQVRRERTEQEIVDAAREKRFMAARDRQKELLQEARADLLEQETRNERLTELYETNGRAIEEQQQGLEKGMGSLSELQTAFNRIATDVSGILGNSLISAQYPQRRQLAQKLVESSELPSVADMESLWELTMETIVDSSQVERFPAQVAALDGEIRQREALRVGSFNIVSQGKFLRYDTETHNLVEPRTQPPPRYLAAAEHFEDATGLVTDVPVDPTRGVLLKLLGQTPDWVTRLRQGGIIGYLIIALGGIGVLIAMERFVVLSFMGSKIKRQLDDAMPRPENPLGRILNVYRENPNADTETLSLKLDEAILRELPRVQRGLGVLSLLAAAAPLMGLLGTVVGIIETFQSITLFGTGDPRLMSSGISLALVTTVIGLVVAIPILFLHSLLTAKSNRLVQILDEKSAGIIAENSEKSHVDRNA